MHIYMHRVQVDCIISGLYRKGLVYLDVPINDDDCITGKHYLNATLFIKPYILVV